jgi:hypothetical protein
MKTSTGREHPMRSFMVRFLQFGQKERGKPRTRQRADEQLYPSSSCMRSRWTSASAAASRASTFFRSRSGDEAGAGGVLGTSQPIRW